jgi:hypothetical protein
MEGQLSELDLRYVDNPNRTYVSYPQLGLAIRIENDQVNEIDVVQIPR